MTPEQLKDLVRELRAQGAAGAEGGGGRGGDFGGQERGVGHQLNMMGFDGVGSFSGGDLRLCTEF